MRLDPFPRFPEDRAQSERKLTDLFRDVAQQVNAAADGQMAASNNARTSIPTTGTFAKGDFVRKDEPSASGAGVVVGWLRLTDGSTHVLDTDWAALVVPNRDTNSAFRLSASKALTGDLTGTNNVFFVRPPAGGGAYYRLTYALVADQADTSAATRDETYGIKSFSATMNSSGTWTSQTAAANEVTERTLGTASAVTVSLVNGTSAGGHIAVACTNYSGSSARGTFYLDVHPMQSLTGDGTFSMSPA